MPTPEWQAQEQRSDALGLGVLAVSILLLIAGPLSVVLLWYLRGRDPQLGIVVPDYITEPPDDLPPRLVMEYAGIDGGDYPGAAAELARLGYRLVGRTRNNSMYLRGRD